MSVKEKGRSYQTVNEYFESWQVPELLKVEGMNHDFNPISVPFFEKEDYEVEVTPPPPVPPVPASPPVTVKEPPNDYTGKPLFQFFREGLFG